MFTTTADRQNKTPESTITTPRDPQYVQSRLEDIERAASSQVAEFDWITGFFHTPGNLNILFVFSDVDNYWDLSLFNALSDSLYNLHGKDYNITYTCLSAQNSQSKLFDMANNELLAACKEADVCVASAPWVLRQLYIMEIAQKTNTPIVFSGVSEPALHGLLRENDVSSDLMTGVIMGLPSYKKQAQVLKALRPDAKYMLVPYDIGLGTGATSAANSGGTKRLSDEWKKLGGKARNFGFLGENDIGAAIAGNAQKNSLVNLSLESSTLAQMGSIVRHANKHGLTLFAHDRISVRRGAAFGSGTSGSTFGPAAAQIISQLVVLEYETINIKPVVIQEDDRMCFHTESLEQQGINLDQSALGLMQMMPVEAVE